MRAMKENMHAWSFDDIANQSEDLEIARELSRAKYQHILECDNIERLVDLSYGKRGTESREIYEAECEEWLQKREV